MLIWGAAGGLGVFATQLCAAAGAECVGVVSSDEKGELVKQLGADGLHQPQRVRGDDAQGRRDARGGEGALQGVARASPSASRRSSATPPDIVFEHVGKATFPTSVLTVKPFGKVVICGATTGYNLDFDVRYLWMRQKEILGSHFANAWECNEGQRADRAGPDPPGAVADDAASRASPRRTS